MLLVVFCINADGRCVTVCYWPADHLQDRPGAARQDHARRDSRQLRASLAPVARLRALQAG